MKRSIHPAARLAAVAGLLLAGIAHAHHSFAVFFSDDKAVVSVRGRVTGFDFKNPHGLIRLEARDASGAVVQWKAETNSPSILERRGWTRDSLKFGDEITIEGWGARDGSRYMRLRKATRADGTTIGQVFAPQEEK
ncbi:MAG: hypothetical protein RLZZ393_1755 [Pseudomonadota bacterium]|jgi:hypothetical protein